jgi:magnesium transporter
MLTGYGLYEDGKLREHFDLATTNVANQLATDWQEASAPNDGAFVWIGFVDPSDDELTGLQEALDIPDHLIEDAVNPKVRPSFDWHGETSGFIVVKILEYVDASSDVLTGQLAIFFDHSHVVTVRHGSVGALSHVREMINSETDITKLGPLAVVHAILNQITDGYVSVAEGVAEDIQNIETAIFEPNPPDFAKAIYELKRENLEIRRAVHPISQAAQYFVTKTNAAIPPELQDDFQDLGEHILRVNEQVESQDQLLSTVLMASMSRQALQQNEDTRKISAWVAIAAVPTMIAGIYGMNFDHMPELSWQYGYGLILGVMGVSCGLLWRAFKKSKWL